jgi:polyisoprenoid-binding protein YceI
MNQLNALAVALALPSAALAAPTNWSIDPSHSSTGFAVKHLVVSTVRGQFTKTGGTLRLDDADLARSSVEATIDAASIDTREPKRDEHLRSPDFFDTAKYPTITFKSTKVARAGKGQLRVTGDLTLHGVTKPVTLDVAASAEVKGMFGETRRGFSGTVKINRKDFGLTWGKVLEAGPVVGDEVTITLDIEAVKEPPKQAAE